MDLFKHIEWHPQIGDPTPMGWITVICYFGAAILAAMMASRVRPVLLKNSEYKDYFHFWSFLGVMLLLMGINKQLDLQTLFTDIGRSVALSQGWYEARRGFQFVFVFVMGIVGLTISAWIAFRFRHVVHKYRSAMIGLGFLVTFILIRAVSFNHIDQFIDWDPGGFRMNWLLELGGIAFIDISAINGLKE